MFRATLSLVIISLWYSAVGAAAPVATHKKLQLTDQFTCEGAYYADFNRDGAMDVVSGPYWYAGPDFQQRHEVREPPKIRSERLLRQLPDLHGRFQRRRLAGHPVLAVAGPGRVLV